MNLTTMEQFKINTLEEACAFCYNDRGIEYPRIFPHEIGLDIRFPDLRVHAKRCKRGTETRGVKLMIKTWKGTSSDAIHYYGVMEVEGIEMVYDKNPSISTTCGETRNVLVDYSYDLTLFRPLTQKEIDEDPKRWEGWDAGDKVKGFESIDEIIELAKQIFRLRFTGDWHLYVGYAWKNRMTTLDQITSKIL